MKRLQIYIEAEADEALAAESARDGVSKAAIIRRLVAEHTGRGAAADPLDALLGAFDGESGDIDDVIYGR
ncbi:MAG: ribbon-helix-helix protein, CopG family [Sporichthyaceae bacterium]